MSPDDYQQVKEIFQYVLELPTDRREAELDVCCPDLGVRREVERLLGSYESGYLEQPAAGNLISDVLNNGHQLSHYKIIRKIGSGGMGDVYMAEDGKLGRNVAIKLLPETFIEDAERLRRFEQEARTASALNHPNILTIFEIGKTDNTHYIATEYIEGETLRSKLNRGRLNVSEALDIAVQCASALAAAHDSGIIHRDIKPENIMLRRDNLVKLLDFGLAKLVEEREAALSHDVLTEKHVKTAPGVIMGTVQYMSPEQTRGQATDTRTDIWSLGCVIYEMLAGSPPFHGETTADLIAEIVKSDPAPLSGVVDDIPDRLKEVVAKTLEKNPAERFQTARDVLIDLQLLNRKLAFETELARLGTPPQAIDTPPLAGAPADGEQPPKRSVDISGKHFTLIGREAEITAVKFLLRDNSVRLLTLTGVGGTGKTTLAKAVAAEMHTDFEGGIYFVDLASVTDPNLVVSTIAQALDLKETGSKPLLDILKSYLRDNPILLIVDNFEQVVSAAAVLSGLVDHAPGLKILVTSRVLLQLRSEDELCVSTLEVPDLSTQVGPAELSKIDSVRLFVERAKSADPSFELTEDNGSAIAEICRSLDGLPLAIELAAARVKIIPPKSILNRLHGRLDLLTGGARDLPARQQTVRATVEWSYDLLPDREQILFRKLAVFAGSFSVGSAEAVCRSNGLDGTEPLTSLEGIEVLEGITSLVNHSLLVKRTQFGGDVRFRFLKVVREYAHELLSNTDDLENMQKAHCNYYVELAEESEGDLQGAHSVDKLNLVEEEHDNFRAALRWSLENSSEDAARIAASIRFFWIFHSHLKEGGLWMKKSLDACPGAPPDIKAKLSNGLGVVAKCQGDYENARIMYANGLAVAEPAQIVPEVALSLRGLGQVATREKQYAEARAYFEKSLQRSRDLGDESEIAHSLSSLGNLARTEGDETTARRLLLASIPIFRKLDNKEALSAVLNNLGAVDCDRRSYETALSYFVEGLEAAFEMQDKIAISYLLDGFAAVALSTNQAERAARLAGAADGMRGSIGYEADSVDRSFRDAYLSKLRAEVSDAVFNVAYDQGRRLNLNEAIDLARGTEAT